MKILTSLIGLILFFVGIYLTYWVFRDFDSYETLILGLYLGGSFILMTLGFYLFLLPLSFKSRNKQDITIEKLVEKHPDPTPTFEREINSEVDAIEIIHEDDLKVSTHQITQEINLNEEQFEPILPNGQTDKLKFNEKEIPQNQLAIDSINSSNHTQDQELKTNEVYDIIEVRVIGIDSWSSQNILKRLDETSLLDLNQKIKSGINMTQVLYKQKLIGYVSRLDMNKIHERLNDLISITPSNMIKDGRKIVHFSINLKFKQKDN